MKKTFEELQKEILEYHEVLSQPIEKHIIEIKSLLFELYTSEEYTIENAKIFAGKIAFIAILINKDVPMIKAPLFVLKEQVPLKNERLGIEGKFDFDTSIDYLCYVWHNVRTTSQEIIHDILLNIIYVLHNGEPFHGILLDVEECLQKIWETNLPIYQSLEVKNLKKI